MPGLLPSRTRQRPDVRHIRLPHRHRCLPAYHLRCAMRYCLRLPQAIASCTAQVVSRQAAVAMRNARRRQQLHRGRRLGDVGSRQEGFGVADERAQSIGVALRAVEFGAERRCDAQRRVPARSMSRREPVRESE